MGHPGPARVAMWREVLVQLSLIKVVNADYFCAQISYVHSAEVNGLCLGLTCKEQKIESDDLNQMS